MGADPATPTRQPAQSQPKANPSRSAQAAATPSPPVAAQLRGRSILLVDDSPTVRKQLDGQGAEPVGNSPEEFAKMLRVEVAKWAEVLKVSGARAD